MTPECPKGQESNLPPRSLRDHVAAAIAVRDGRHLGLEPLADATYEEMADEALKFVGTEVERLAVEVGQLRTDMRIRQGALNDVLGRERSANYYSAVEEVAELKREVSRLREQLAAQPTLPPVDDDRIDRVAQALHEQRALEFAWNVKPWKDLRAEDQRRFRRQAMAAVEAVFSGVSSTLVPKGVQPGEFFEEDEPVERVVAAFDNALKFTAAPSTSAAPIHLEGRPSFDCKQGCPAVAPECWCVGTEPHRLCCHEDAAQAARSEAPPEALAAHAKVMADQHRQFADFIEAHAPSPSLRKEGEDSDHGR